MQSSLALSIRTSGYISASRPQQERGALPAKEKMSVNDFVAKVTSIFTPHMKPELSDREFAVLEGEVKKAALKFKGGM